MEGQWAVFSIARVEMLGESKHMRQLHSGPFHFLPFFVQPVPAGAMAINCGNCCFESQIEKRRPGLAMAEGGSGPSKTSFFKQLLDSGHI